MSGEPTDKNGGEKCGNRPPFSVEYRSTKNKPQGGCRAVNDTRIASKAKAQLANFMGKEEVDLAQCVRPLEPDVILPPSARRTADICPSSIVLKDIYYSSFLESYVYPSVVPRIDIVGIKLPPVFLQLSSWSIGFSHDSYHLFICHAYM